MPIVRTRHVSLTNKEGGRLKQAIWSKPRRWMKLKSVGANLKAAINFALRYLQLHRIGTVVYIGDTPVFHCKWGVDGRSFSGWKSNPVAAYWQNKLGK